MSKYKIRVSFDEKNFFWVVIDRENFIRNPTKEDLIGATIKSYNKTNICPICREEWKRHDVSELTEKSILWTKNARQGENVWLCEIHNNRYRQKLPDSRNNLIKSMRDHRIGNLDPDSTGALGDDCEELTGALFDVNILSIEYDKYSQLPLDHSPIPEGISLMIGEKLVDLSGKIPQTKGRRYNPDRKNWQLATEREWYKEFDVIILHCISKDRKYIERIYIIPKEEILEIKGIGIYKYDSNGNLYEKGWYEKYRVKDEKILECANKIWKKILEKRKLHSGRTRRAI